MKKAFALIMAIAMVASMAAVSFAAVGTLVENTTNKTDVKALVGVSTWPHTMDSDKNLNAVTDNMMAEYGETLYVLLYNEDDAWITAEKAAAGLDVSAKWDENGAYVEGVELVKKKVADRYVGAEKKEDIDKAIYMIAIETTGDKAGNVEVVGTLYLKGKSGTGDELEKINAKAAVSFTLGYEVIDCTTGDKEAVGEDKAVYDFTGNDEDEFELDFAGVEVTANVKNQKKVVLAADNEVIDEIDEAYPEADIEYYNLFGTLRKTATVVIPGEEGSYLYEVVDGALVAVDAEYDDWAEEFTFKARTLGSYIVSDTELVTESVVVTNPSTGAAA